MHPLLYHASRNQTCHCKPFNTNLSTFVYLQMDHYNSYMLKRHLDRLSSFCMCPKCYAVQCIANGGRNPQNCLFPSGFRHPVGGGPIHSHRRTHTHTHTHTDTHTHTHTHWSQYILSNRSRGRSKKEKDQENLKQKLITTNKVHKTVVKATELKIN